MTRLGRLERAHRPQPSPFERAFGSLDAFEADTWAAIDAGALDGREMPLVMAAIRRWHKDGVWATGR